MGSQKAIGAGFKSRGWNFRQGAGNGRGKFIRIVTEAKGNRPGAGGAGFPKVAAAGAGSFLK